ncbi:hypothetical protein E2C01_029058 [Portunus trituberculatus]|uniref:Uncharacterized protein n=1 Tax=Portunus trituberculatus TaxID=210409 RepID=A0A5B7EN64_PORTR|nr:hypothetical protein [Portunus trituberculatus]
MLMVGHQFIVVLWHTDRALRGKSRARHPPHHAALPPRPVTASLVFLLVSSSELRCRQHRGSRRGRMLGCSDPSRAASGPGQVRAAPPVEASVTD